MFLPATQNTIRLSGFPRVRGYVPQGVPGTKDLKRFSPRARGCSHINFIFHQIWVVFPACAGMFPNRYHPDGHARCFPRVRGDVPPFGRRLQLTYRFSPRARGCSYDALGSGGGPWGFPRVRGDVPRKACGRHGAVKFSPRARGCSSGTHRRHPKPWVFPACAGMFPPRLRRSPPTNCFPRVRGDVPFSASAGGHWAVFSPRARGCSPTLIIPAPWASVFPACAGMFLC